MKLKKFNKELAIKKLKLRNDKNRFIKIFIVVLCIFIIGLLVIYLSFSKFSTINKYNVMETKVGDFSSGDVKFALFVNDNSSTNMPTKGSGYSLDTSKTTCSNGASVVWDYNLWGPIVTNLTADGTKCSLYFKSVSYLNNYLVDVAKNNSDTMFYDGTTDNNLRYFGASPSNYVTYNGEVWRIIGVINNMVTSTGETKSLVKIVRNTQISSGITFSSSNVNDYSKSELMDLLNNGAYYNRTGTYASIGLDATARNLIESVVWSLGGSSTSSLYVNDFYAKERGTTVYSGHATSWTGKVAVVYPSDWGYAAGTCFKTSYLSSAASTCINNDWMQINWGNATWALTPNSSSASYQMMFWSNYVVSDVYGGSYYPQSSYARAVFPTLYLSSDVIVTGGTGTSSDPYTISK